MPGRLGLGLAKAFLLFHVWYVGSTSLMVLCFRFVDPAATTLSVYRRLVDGWELSPRRSVRLAEVPSLARRMLVSVEDSRFWDHHGVDLEAIARAREVNRRLGRPLYGGSTLTMQVARTLFLLPVKSYVRKYLEVIVALELELLLPKARILELYLSWAEWGRGVFGIEAAARRHYGVSVGRLGPQRLASLVAVLSSPIRFNPATIAKSGLLSSRYEFLLERYVR